MSCARTKRETPFSAPERGGKETQRFIRRERGLQGGEGGVRLKMGRWRIGFVPLSRARQGRRSSPLPR